ncbi:hypothetical protein GCM10009839_70140 [Catenulispora yoronensis]|uniref:Uncharacterized protein n=1 Tax=Catenulispora yoronensis TaxID=450799 RepID=A0ABP5GSB4_9ACTN
MFGFAAVALFAIAFIVNGTATSVSNAWLTPTSLMLAGLACLAVHMLGYQAAWRPSARRASYRRRR